jgi:ATP-dependent Lon protease
MDETFEAVDFSYVNRLTGKKVSIETLEVVEYLNIEKLDVLPNSSAEKTDNSKIEKIKIKPLSNGQRIILDNQTGISYENLFGDYLAGANSVTLIDPYIRLPYQLRNLMEFAKLLSEKKNKETELRLHLITNNNEDFIEGAKDAFSQITYSLETIGIIFTYEFDENIHDRSIKIDNGWKIILGRGLDIWQKTGGWYDINEYLQEKRLCKACEVTFISELWGVTQM